jgi:hypothetical protein
LLNEIALAWQLIARAQIARLDLRLQQGRELPVWRRRVPHGTDGTIRIIGSPRQEAVHVDDDRSTDVHR